MLYFLCRKFGGLPSDWEAQDASVFRAFLAMAQEEEMMKAEEMKKMERKSKMRNR